MDESRLIPYRWIATELLEYVLSRTPIPAVLDSADWQATAADAVKSALHAAAARYLLEGRSEDGLLADPVARFHIGNGARLEQVNWLGDYHWILVNYLYDLRQIEKNYQSLSERDEVPASSAVRKLARKPSARTKLMFFSRPTPMTAEAAESWGKPSDV